jgi:site-specific recombinase XerD
MNERRPNDDYDGAGLLGKLLATVPHLRVGDEDRELAVLACRFFVNSLNACEGQTLQQRWITFEQRVWPEWKGSERRLPSHRRTWGPRIAVTNRIVRPGATWLASVRVLDWVGRLPEDDPLVKERDLLFNALETVRWAGKFCKHVALSNGMRILLAKGYVALHEIREHDLAAHPSWSKGADVLDAALCTVGVFSRTPQQGASRRHRRGRLSPADMVAKTGIPEPFRQVSALYLETYATRISDVYSTRRNKAVALNHFWQFVVESYPEVRRCKDVLPVHARAYLAKAVQRSRHTQSAHTWLISVRTFFADICGWASEPGSPFASLAPPTVPLTRHDLMGAGFKSNRQDSANRITATVLDLEREMPNIRALAFRSWQQTKAAAAVQDAGQRVKRSEIDAFWTWAVLELLVQSGLRVEEATELTALDILKRRTKDGRVYYMLHVKPSKYDRARVIPIGDGLGRVLAEIIRRVKDFYNVEVVPFSDHWDRHEKRPLPRAPYLLQGAGHPSAMSTAGITNRVSAASVAAGARKSDGTALILRPHDCRRVFASEHLNNNMPVHVIQALLGHATPDTVMVYAKLYPQHLLDEYRKTVRGLYRAVHGEGSLRNPTVVEWAAFEASCSLRDMGTHLCALPTGEYCPRGLVCLGCVHAQPKKSAVPIFRRMLASHERQLNAAKDRGEPAGQIASRELEVVRIKSALRRAEELSADVAAAIESAVG